MERRDRRSILGSLLAAGALPLVTGRAHAGNSSRYFRNPFYEPQDQGLDAPVAPQDPWAGQSVGRGETPDTTPADPTAPFDPNPRAMYAAVADDTFPVPAVRPTIVAPRFWRQMVAYDGGQPEGTIIVDPGAHHLYLALGDGTAIRYGVGVGRSGFGWSGEAVIRFKRSWPDWYPPPEMLDRQPELAEKMQTLQSGIGMPGGPGNPLGARALYLWQGNKDTLYRIHGTVEPASIGKSVSSGCIRMINQDVIDLYGRIAVGTRVVVLGAGSARRSRDAGAG